MPRIRPLESHETPLLSKPFLAVLRRMFGKPLTPYRIQARRPGILWFGALLGVVIERAGKKDLRIHELVQLRTAQMIGCPF